MPGNNFNPTPYRQLLLHPGLGEEERALVRELLEKAEQISAENLRLRKTIQRLSSANSPKMSSKLRDALYE
ncbi:hypothetical protein V3851_01235 [Paenibacillus sp. M1]|uniref:Uncharacterized protein n=1 Tax=Paenibacillus haidiansis TaxID=1574488 RepID=A0ABU7VM57_9BACL